ncbi:MAG: PEP-CTERM sorting domain-containing protein [Deltaproteobacteria bacterium]|nr:PEP-CTERM sorting domain-containing protein [Deltaproteobacteria bacterium]
MKKILFFLCSMLLVIFFTGTAGAYTLDLHGDKDGFGVGVPIGDGYHYLEYGAYYTDNRDASEQSTTDTDCWWTSANISWTHTYTLPVESIIWVQLDVYVAGIVNESDWYADVFVDGYKFDAIDGIDGADDLTRLLTFNLPVEPFIDGETTFSIAPYTIGDPGTVDGFIMDYAELRAGLVDQPTDVHPVSPSSLHFIINSPLDDTFSFDYQWEEGVDPAELNLDVLFYNGETWESFGWAVNFDGDPDQWVSASFLVPQEARGDNAQIMFSLLDWEEGTDPTVYVTNFSSSSVPEPTTMILLGFSLIGLARLRRKA